MALEIAWLTLAVLVGLVSLAFALNSGTAGRLHRVPVLGAVLGGLRTLINLVVHG